MRFLVPLLLIFIFALPALADHHERRFKPTEKFTLKIDDVQVEVPYAYLREHWQVKLEKGKVVNAQEQEQSGIFFQYLFPSLAPPPNNCKPNESNCIGKAVTGFEPAPTKEKQFYVNYILRNLKKKVPTEVDTAQFLRGPTANHVLYGDKFKENKKLGLIESKPFLDFERYVPLTKLKHVTHISCLSDTCFFKQYDEENGLSHALTIHKDALHKWKEILASRQKIFERYLKK